MIVISVNFPTQAIKKTLSTRKRTTTAKLFNKNKDLKCKCQSQTHLNAKIVSSSKEIRNRTNVNMQTLQQPQPAQQQQQQHQHQPNMQPQSCGNSQLLHLNLPIETTSAYIENGLITPTTPHHMHDDCTTASMNPDFSPSCSSPPSPSSASSISSSESSSTHASPSLGVNLRVTGQCSQGGRKYMEDYFSVAYQHSENAKDLEYAFFGIFDGHGGAEAATFAKEHLMMKIINQKLFWSDSDQDVLRAIREGYIATHFAMWREQDKWPKTANGLPSTAGTTATVAFIRHEKIYIGHVGDSGIVLGYQNEGEKCWRAKQLTIDHKPESMAERARIMRSGGKVVVKSGVPRVVWNRPRNASHRGPIRHNTPIDEIPFLAVARSLGDLWSYNSLCNEFVVSPDPDVRVIRINPKTFRCLIFGTDGLWNVVTPQEAVNTVFHNETVNERMQRSENLSNESGWMNPSKALVDRALGTWSSKKMRADNTSVVTVILHPPNTNEITDNIHMSNINNASKLQGVGCLSDCFGLEYTHVNSGYGDSEDTITYREMAEKYLPPEEYRNFNYFEDTVECNGFSGGGAGNGKRSFFDDRYMKLALTSPRFFYMCGDKEPRGSMDSCRIKDAVKGTASSRSSFERGIHLCAADDNDGLDEEECVDYDDDDDDDDDGDDENVANENEEAENQNDVLVSNNYVPHFMRDDEKILSESINSFNVNDSEIGSVDETTTSSYMSTFAESYNTLLGGDSVGGSDAAHIVADVSTSSSSSSYKSHSATCIQELVQEQQLYQQQCMSEEEGYSLTKLETRREQQRCSASGVQTFRIFQQQDGEQQQQQQKGEIDQDDNLKDVQRTRSPNAQINGDENYMWEPRFPSAFSGSQQQRYQNYQDQHSQFLLEQQLKSLELNSLLQQEREEEQQVELERQMEMERHQQRQSQQSNPQLEQKSEDSDRSIMATSDLLLVHGNDNASSEVLASITTNGNEETDADIAIDEEYLLFDEDEDLVEDASVQINEISSSSSCCLLKSDGAEKTTTKSTLKKVQDFPTIRLSPSMMSPRPSTSSSSPREAHHFGSTPASASSTESQSIIDSIESEAPKIIEKLENIEILHDKPELVIETTPVSTISTRSKHKTNTAPIVSSTNRRGKTTNATTKLHFPNVPNENQHREKSGRVKQKIGVLQLTPVATLDAQLLYSKRQLRSTSSSGNSNSNSNSSSTNSICNITSTNRKNCFHPQNSLNNAIDYVKRTLRTRNSLAKDLKAKTTLLSSNIKRNTSAVTTTRFLRTTQAVSLLNLHQSPQVLASSCKKTPTTSSSPALVASGCSMRRPQQPQPQPQRPLSTTSFNFINLRSRQIGSGSNGSSVSNFPEQRQPSSTPIATSARKSLHLTTSNTPSNAMNSTPAYVRRNLRSVSAVRTCIKGKVTVSACSNGGGLTNYCKSMRSQQSATALVTPPPPSPKHLNPAATNCSFAVTRAQRTATNVILSAPSATNAAHVLNSAMGGLQSSRKRAMRTIESNESVLTASRAPKRLRRSDR